MVGLTQQATKLFNMAAFQATIAQSRFTNSFRVDVAKLNRSRGKRATWIYPNETSRDTIVLLWVVFAIYLGAQVKNKFLKIITIIAIPVIAIGLTTSWKDNDISNDNKKEQNHRLNDDKAVVKEKSNSQQDKTAIKDSNTTKSSLTTNKKIAQTLQPKKTYNLGGEITRFDGVPPEQYSKYEYEFINFNKEDLISLKKGDLFSLYIHKESTNLNLKADSIDKSTYATSIVANELDETSGNSATISYDSNNNVFGDIRTTNGQYVLIANDKFSALIDAKTFYYQPKKPVDDVVIQKNQTHEKE